MNVNALKEEKWQHKGSSDQSVMAAWISGVSETAGPVQWFIPTVPKAV